MYDGFRSRKAVTGINGLPKRKQFFLSMLDKERKEEERSHLVSTGTCCLHTPHNLFKHSENATEWKLKQLLSSVYKISHDSKSST